MLEKRHLQKNPYLERPTTDGDGSLPGSGGGGQVAGARWCSLVGGGRLRAVFTSNVLCFL